MEKSDKIRDKQSRAITDLKHRVDLLNENQIRIETRLRRNNLILHNVDEAPGAVESCAEVIKHVMRDKLQITSWNDIKIEASYRLGMNLTGETKTDNDQIPTL